MERECITPPAGFTLVELLVVIGIIALLISILLPSLNRARATAIRTTCLARMRELNNATRLYATENRDSLPPIWAASDYPTVHFNRPAIFSTTGDPKNDCYLTKYMGVGDTAKRFICPALGGQVVAYSATAGQSYRYNQLLGGHRGIAIQKPMAVPNYYYTKPYNFGQIRQASKMAVFLDSDLITTGFGNGGNAMWFRVDNSTISTTPGNSFYWPNFQGNFQSHIPGQSNKGTYVGFGGGVYPVQTGLVNIAYADGSVRPTPYRVDSYPVKFQGDDFFYVDPARPQAKW